jgi:hypothetical protein
LSVQQFPDCKVAKDFYIDLEGYKEWEKFALNDPESIKKYKGKWVAFQNGKVLMYGDSYHSVFNDEVTIDCLLFSKFGFKKVDQSEVVRTRKKKGIKMYWK